MALRLHTRQVLGGLAAAGFLTLSTAVPAAARPYPGPPLPTPDSSQTTVVREAAAPVALPVDDTKTDVLQIGLGAIVGIALAGAGFTVYGRRERSA